MTIIAQCVASTGYGTDYYDPETHDCFQSGYASVDHVILNPEYWSQYERMSSALSCDFDLPMGFDDFVLMVDDQGKRSFREPKEGELNAIFQEKTLAEKEFAEIERSVLAAEHVLAREEQMGNMPLLHQRIHKLLPKQAGVVDEIMRLVDKFLGK